MKQLIVTSFLALVLILSETRFSGPTSTVALTDEQRKEIQDLRADLDNAFEKDDEKTLKAHGAITQPDWTQDHRISKITKTKVTVTKSGLNEAKQLRDEINKAIQQDRYSPILGSSNVGANTSVIQELHKQYVTNANNKKPKVGNVVSAKTPGDGPKIMDAFSTDDPAIDMRKLQRLELSKRRTRETLILESIEEDFSFNLGEHVQEWEHIIHGGQEFFIGRLEKDLQIVHKNALHYEASQMVHIGTSITYLETYTFWNPDQQQQEGIIIIATENQVQWYRADEKLGKIALYWDWVVGTTVSGLTYFRADGLDYLVVSTNQSSRAGYYALNIYQFDLKNKEFWITQRLQLSHPCEEVTLLNTGRDYILAVPQNNTAAIYTFNPHIESSGHVHFQLKHNFDSEGIQYITAFQMGGRSYLALGGMKPQILLYQQGEFIVKTIFGNNFGLVEFFFPIPVRTYRDDLLLLVQHRVDFNSHKLTVVETLIWDGEAFEVTLPAPCKLASHTVYGVNCMLDIQRDAGLKGAAILRRGNEVSIIVPRHEAESGLFRLHTKLLAKNSELKDLQDIFDFMKEWVAEQDAFIAQAQSFTKQQTNEPNFENLQLLKTPELFFNGALNELHVNDYKWTDGDSAMDLNHIMNEIEQLENEIRHSRHKRNTDEFKGHSASFESLDFDDVDAEFVEVEKLNDAPFYVQNGALDFEGILNFVELEVLESEHLQEAREAMLEELILDNDIEFENINDIPWRNIAENLVFQNRPLKLESLEVEATVTVQNQLEIKTLNTLRFEEDFLLADGQNNSIVYAPKTFKGILSSNFADTQGYINGKDALDVITLSEEQDWSGSPTFSDLEVLEMLEINGTARVRGARDFPTNPTLEESKTINAHCEFANLIVLGAIKVENDFNNETLETILSDIVQRPENPEEEIQITGKKNFTNVEFPIDFHVLDNKINNISVHQFIPRQTDQELSLTRLEGYVYFNNLTITGSYDGVMIDELIRNTIKIDQPQNLSTTQLNFAGFVKAHEVNVIKTLNEVPIAMGYQTINEDLVIPKAYFETLKAEEGNIAGDIKGVSKLNGIELSTFLEAKNSSNSTEKPHSIFVNELVLEAGLQVDEIHGLNAEFLYEFLAKIDSLPEMVLDGKIHVDRVTISGNVQVNTVNGQNFDDDIQLTAIWLNRPNYLSTKLQFIDTIDLQSDLNVLGDYNNKNLPDLIDDMVFRNSNGTVLILAPKKFTGYVHVLDNTQVDALNGIPFTNYANKRKGGIFQGSLQINGNLIVLELSVNGGLNEFPVSELSNLIWYDRNLEAFVLKGVTNLERPLELEDLTIYGDLNEIENLKGFFENLVYKADSCFLNGQYNFTGRVTIEHGVYIGSLNGHNLLDLFNDIVFINGLEPLVINSPINFTSAVKMPIVNIKGALTTSNLNGCSVKAWFNDTLNLENSMNVTTVLYFAPGSLHGNSFYASFLNTIDLSKVITLNTPQNLSENLQFSEVYLDGAINVSGLINGVDLQEEFENTLLTTGDQYIRTPLTVHAVNVLQNLQTKKPINVDKQLEQVATRYEDNEFESPLFFEELRAKDIYTEDPISGINFSDWYKFALWKEGRAEQRITGNWSVESLSVKNGPSMPESVVGSARTISGEEDFKDLCQKYRNLQARYSRRSYALKHINKAFELDLNNYNLTAQVKEIHKAFKIRDYLLVNSGCYSAVFKWNATDKHYNLITSFESGMINQLAVATDNATQSEFISFVTSTVKHKMENCTFVGLNLWKLEADKIKHLKSFAEHVTELWAAGSKGHIFAITDDGVKIIFTTSPYSIKPFDSIASSSMESLSFIAHSVVSKKLYYNSTHFAKISQDPIRTNRHRRAMPLRNGFPKNYPRSIHLLLQTDESILKPNATLVKKLNFADFIYVIERILEDLDYRLNIEINFTQLSIPESDLYDAYLIEDFIAIIEELRTQQIYPSKYFVDIKLDSIQIPDNPAQVLAARAVQFVWPVIVEIDEIHRYLRDNSTTEHPACACILNQLGIFIKEVLAAANTPAELKDNETLDYTEVLNAVISRIRQFQEDLKALETELKLEIIEDLNIVLIDHEKQTEEASQHQFEEKISESNKQFSSSTQTDSLNYSLQIHKYPEPYNIIWREMIGLEVGAAYTPYTLMAITHAQSRLTPGQADGINLYTDLSENSLFQYIPAHKPHSLVTMRIRDITLLAYVERCCTLSVLQYRGVEGFVSFAKITSKVPISHVMELSLPHADFGQRYYFVAVLSHKFIFYEVVFTGLREVPSTDLLNCN